MQFMAPAGVWSGGANAVQPTRAEQEKPTVSLRSRVRAIFTQLQLQPLPVAFARLPDEVVLQPFLLGL